MVVSIWEYGWICVDICMFMYEESMQDERKEFMIYAIGLHKFKSKDWKSGDMGEDLMLGL